LFKELCENDKNTRKNIRQNEININIEKNGLCEDDKNKKKKIEDNLLFNKALEGNPHKFVKYMIYSQIKIKDLYLTIKYNDLCKLIKNAKNKSEIKQIWKTNWNWGSLKLPVFNAMPLILALIQFLIVSKPIVGKSTLRS
jgi:hypothetical protein